MTIRDIARAAGVSPTTVSKIINQKDENISDETRQRVLQIIRENEYIPYAGVRDRLLAQNNTIALLWPDLHDSFMIAFANEAQHYAASRGYSLTLYTTNGDPQNEMQIIRKLSEDYICGLLFSPTCLDSLDYFSEPECNIKNAVFLDYACPQSPFPQFFRDFSGMANDCTHYLIRNNCHHIALVLNNVSGSWIHNSILSGFKDALASNDIVYKPDLVIYSDNELDRRIAHLIGAGIDAIVCQDTLLTGEIYRIISRKNFKIPNDLSLICLDDNITMKQFFPPITAISVDAVDMARSSIDAVIAQISSERSSFASTCLPYNLIVRNSVKVASKPKYKIVVAGSINMDITLKIPRMPKLGETLLATSLNSWPGGKGANQAIGVSRFGGDAFFLGRLGNDLYGKQLYEQLIKENVNMQGVSFVHDKPTGTAYVNVQTDGQNTIVVNPGANTSLLPSYVEKNKDLFDDVCYCLIQLEIPLASVESIIDICKLRDIKVILKPSPVQYLPSSILDDLFLLVPNQEEMERLVPDKSSPEQQAVEMLKKGVQNVIVTLGENGCVHVCKDKIQHHAAFPFPCIDSTGASDIFISCLATQLAKGKCMDSAIELALLAASFSVSKEGVQNSILDSEMLSDLFEGRFSISSPP